MRYRNELMLFQRHDDYLAPLKPCLAGTLCKNPICISGVYAGEAPPGQSNYNGEHVIVTGRLVSYRSLRDEDFPVIPRKLLEGKVVMNYCLRDKIIVISAVTPG